MKKRAKILYILPRFYPFKGGAEQHFFELGKQLVEEGHRVTVLTSDFSFDGTPLEKDELIKGIHVIRMKSFIFRPMTLWFAPNLLIKLFQEDFDVLHVSGFGFIWVEFCIFIRKIKNDFTAINTPHGPFMAFQKKDKTLRGISKSIYSKILAFMAPRLYSKVIAVVPEQKIWLKEDYNFLNEQIELVPNGISESFIEDVPLNEKQKNPILVTFTGRMEWYKGIQDVIEAIKIINEGKKKVPNFKFIAMGRADKYTDNLQQLIAKYELEDVVELVFAPSDEERDEYYRKSSIFVLPSKWEATGIVLLEAMSKGNALISTNQNEACSIIIKEGESGYSYDFGDEDELANILVKLLKDQKLRIKIIQHNKEFSKNFTWEAIFPDYLDIITRIIK